MAAAWSSRRVSMMSATDASSTPDGWLCATANDRPPRVSTAPVARPTRNSGNSASATSVVAIVAASSGLLDTNIASSPSSFTTRVAGLVAASVTPSSNRRSIASSAGVSSISPSAVKPTMSANPTTQSVVLSSSGGEPHSEERRPATSMW